MDQQSPRPAARGASRDRGAAETRAALIDGAIVALREVGFAGASARQIAQRADCNQALIFYHFGSVRDLLVAAMEDISARRMTAYRGLLDHTGTLTELVDCARSIFEEDLDAGHVTVLVEMINGAQSVPGLGEQVSACLAPWREVAQVAVRDVLAASPFAALIPAREVAHGVVAGILGLELLANLDADRASALALFDRARALAGLLDLTGGLMQPGGAQRVPQGGRPPSTHERAGERGAAWTEERGTSDEGRRASRTPGGERGDTAAERAPRTGHDEGRP